MSTPPVREHPRVTVLMTLFNKADFVEEAIFSVLESTMEDLELLVVDDGSTDGGPERVRRFNDPRIRVLPSIVNTGRAAAANRGLDAARGEFVAILDADDRMDPSRLEKQVTFMDAHPDHVACGSAARMIGRASHIASWPAEDGECRARLVFEDPMLYGAAIFRRSALEAHAIRCDPDWGTPGMDYLFQVALAPHGRLANLHEPLTHYRIHETNMRRGRDPVADKYVLQKRVFAMLGVPVTEAELRDHLMFHRLFFTPPDAQSVRRLKDWSERLMNWNRERHFADSEEFERMVRSYWNHLFHVLPDHGIRPALVHIMAWRPVDWPHLLYLLKHIARKRVRLAR